MERPTGQTSSLHKIASLVLDGLDHFIKSRKELFRYRRNTTIGVGVLNTNKVAHFQRDKIFYLD